MTDSHPDWSSEDLTGGPEQPDWFTAGPPPPPPPSRGRRFVAGSGAALRASGRVIGRGSRATARGVAIGSRAANARFQRFSRADGADASGLARFVEMHGINVAADAALTVSLAGTVFAMPVDEARGQVALFLLLTMAPFVVLAPLIGPVLDRFRHGRRWAIGATLALRGFLAWVLASAIVDDSAWLFPAALGCLVASRAYAVARAAAIPRLLPDGMTLVRANSRLNIVGILGMTLGGVLAGAVSRIGPEWSLRLAFVIYVLATIWAIRLPAAVDSTIGEGEVDDTVPNPTDSATPSRFRHRVRVLPPDVRYALWLNSGARILTGFLTLFLAFLMREQPIPGWSGTLVLGMVVAAASLGTGLGSVIGNWRRLPPPQVIASGALGLAVTSALVAAVFYSLWTLVALGLVAGMSSQLAKLSLDALVQDQIPDHARARVFAWAETMLQAFWVVGGGIGIAIPLDPRLGFGLVTVLLVGAVLVALRSRAIGRRPVEPAPNDARS